MGKSVFKELFGEGNEVEKKEKRKKQVKKEKVQKEENVDKAYKIYLAFSITLLVFCITFALTVLTSNTGYDEKKVLGETSVKLSPFEVENSLDRFVKKFTESYYKVDDSGEFGYIYNEIEDGIISLDQGLGETYFEKGRIVLFDFDKNTSVFWDKHNRKLLFWEEQEKYFLVLPGSDYYYKRYVGQHILQSFVNDYLKNKDFIIPIDENTWAWEWSFFTPINQEVKHSMEATVFINPETEYLEQIKLSDGQRQVCVFEFSYKKVDGFDFSNLFDGYTEINEDEITPIL